MNAIRKLILALALAAGLAPAFAAPPPPVPALPDTERRTSYSISGTTCICAVNFQLYGDSTDVDNWVEVWVNGTRYLSTDPTFGWSLSSTTGSLGTIPRPITNAVLTFNSVQTGTVQIVSAQRPRRLSTFNENQGVAARDFNQVLNSLTAQLRDNWDKTNDVTGRALLSQPGNVIGPLPLPSVCAGNLLGFDGSGLNPVCMTNLGSGNVVLPVVSGNYACFNGTSGSLQDCAIGPKLELPADVRAYGAKCDGVADDHVAIQSALNVANGALIPGTCSIGTSTLTFGNVAHATLTGLNSESSVLTSASTTAPMINVVATIPGLKIAHLGLTRSVTATAGATGINFLGYVDLPVIDDVEVQKQYIGISLSSTGYGKLSNSFIHNNVSDGVVMQTPTIANTFQWYLDTVLSQTNGGWGYHVIAPPTAAISNQVTMGTWTNTFSFTNTSGGASFNGNSSVSIQGVRINGGFWGTDGGAEGNFDTYNTAGGPHQITGLFAEINTNGACLNFTGNNNTVGITGGAVIGCNTSGIVNNATLMTIAGTQIVNNTTFGLVTSTTAFATGSNFNNNTSGAISNSGSYTGRGNTPTTANTAFGVSEGGTGQTSLTANAFLTGNGTGPINFVAITGLVLGNGAGAPTAYGGTSCTNQFPRSLNASGAATCASVAIGSDVSGLGSGVPAVLAINIGLAGSPVLLNGAGGTPTSITLTNGTNLPCSGISSLATGICTWLATPNSANLASAVTDETGSGSLVFGTGPTLSNPIVGTQAANDNSTKAASTAYVDRVKKVISTNTTFNYGPGGSDSNGCTNSSSDKCLTPQGTYDTIVDNYIVKGKNTVITIQADTNTAYTTSLVTGRCVQGDNTPTTVQILGQAQTSATVTITIATPGVITWTGHGFSANQPFYLSTTGALPTNATAFTKFYVKTVLDANTFTFSTTAGGSAVNTTGTQSGTHTGTSLPNTSIITTSADAISLGAASNGAGSQGCTKLGIGGFALGTVTSGNTINVAGGGVGVTFGITGYPIEFTATAQDHVVANHSAWAVSGTTNIVSGNALIHMASISNATVATHNSTEVYLGAPAFTYYNYTDTNGTLFSDNMTFTNGSVVTGTRYFAGNGGIIYTNGSSTYLPGNASGVEFMGGNYIGSTLRSGLALFTSGALSFISQSVTVAGQTCTLASTCGLSSLTNSIGADVNLNNISNYFDGPSVAQGTTGTWFASGTVTIGGTSGDTIYCKLWDGTTVISSGRFDIASGLLFMVALSGALTTPAGNIRISCRDIINTTGKIYSNTTGNAKDSTITAFRIN